MPSVEVPTRRLLCLCNITLLSMYVGMKRFGQSPDWVAYLNYYPSPYLKNKPSNHSRNLCPAQYWDSLRSSNCIQISCTHSAVLWDDVWCSSRNGPGRGLNVNDDPQLHVTIIAHTWRAGQLGRLATYHCLLRHLFWSTLISHIHLFVQLKFISSQHWRVKPLLGHLVRILPVPNQTLCGSATYKYLLNFCGQGVHSATLRRP